MKSLQFLNNTVILLKDSEDPNFALRINALSPPEFQQDGETRVVIFRTVSGERTAPFAVADFVGALTNEYFTIPALLAPESPNPLADIESYVLSFFSGRVSFSFQIPETSAITSDVDIALPFTQGGASCIVSVFSVTNEHDAVTDMPLLVVNGILLTEFSSDAALVMTGALPVPQNAALRFVSGTNFSGGNGALITVTLQ